MSENQPTVLILLASHNGSLFLKEQIESILNQEGVKLKILISDDNSIDGSLDIIKGMNSKYIEILKPKKIGSAAGNFFRLINLSEEDYDYFAFADQDDIWKTDKLINAIKKLRSTNSFGYSSSFQYFWGSDLKSEKYFSKGSKLTSIDYIFSSPGPGCTFVLNRHLFKIIKKTIFDNWEKYKLMAYHDWAIYATARGLGYKWIIDDNSFLYYRQHANNEIGVNRSFKGIINRLKRFWSRWYELEILKIIEILKLIDDPVIKRLAGLNLFSFAVILSKESRRKRTERLIILLNIIIGKLNLKTLKNKF